MTVRTGSIAAIAACGLLGAAHAAPNEAPAASRLVSRAPAADAGLSAYRQYAKTQADLLVGMTKVLAREVKSGNLEAAQMAYAPAHRYLARLAPIAKSLHDLDKRMDASADAYERREADPEFSGFHRIEYGLFTNKSTKNLSDTADRLEKDARALRERLASLEATPAMLLDGAIDNLHEISDRGLAGNGERYSKTDLWDIEANIESVREVAAVTRSQPRSVWRRASIAARFAAIEARLERHKAGCGFKNFDELTRDDKAALRAPITALAEELSALRGPPATD